MKGGKGGKGGREREGKGKRGEFCWRCFFFVLLYYVLGEDRERNCFERINDIFWSKCKKICFLTKNRSKRKKKKKKKKKEIKNRYSFLNKYPNKEI